MSIPLNNHPPSHPSIYHLSLPGAEDANPRWCVSRVAMRQAREHAEIPGSLLSRVSWASSLRLEPSTLSDNDFFSISHTFAFLSDPRHCSCCWYSLIILMSESQRPSCTHNIVLLFYNLIMVWEI